MKELEMEVNQKIKELQHAVAEYVKAEMPERSKYGTILYYVGDAYLFVNGAINISAPSAELKEQCKRLESAGLYEEQKKLQERLDKVNNEIKAMEARQ